MEWIQWTPSFLHYPLSGSSEGMPHFDGFLCWVWCDSRQAQNASDPGPNGDLTRKNGSPKVVSEKSHGNWMLRRVSFRVRVNRIKLNGTAVFELNSNLLCVALTPGWFAESIGCCPEWPQRRWLGDSLGCQSTWANLLWRRWWRWSAKKTGYGGVKIRFEM